MCVARVSIINQVSNGQTKGNVAGGYLEMDLDTGVICGSPYRPICGVGCFGRLRLGRWFVKGQPMAKSKTQYAKLQWFKCLLCNWFGVRAEPFQCEHHYWIRRLYGIVRD